MAHPVSLGARLEALGRRLGAREAEYREALERARDCAEMLHRVVVDAVEHFHAGVTETGAPHLRIEVSEVRVDDKHVRAVEFDLLRGRHKAVVVVKARGDVTLVGPFQLGKTEGPCQSFALEASDEFDEALGSFLERFSEEALEP